MCNLLIGGDMYIECTDCLVVFHIKIFMNTAFKTCIHLQSAVVVVLHFIYLGFYPHIHC